MPKGTVKWFNKIKGYGFIKSEDGVDFFVHSSSVAGIDSKALLKGETVTFEIGRGRKGPVANRVQVSGKKHGIRRQDSLMKKRTKLNWLIL